MHAVASAPSLSDFRSLSSSSQGAPATRTSRAPSPELFHLHVQPPRGEGSSGSGSTRGSSTLPSRSLPSSLSSTGVGAFGLAPQRPTPSRSLCRVHAYAGGLSGSRSTSSLVSTGVGAFGRAATPEKLRPPPCPVLAYSGSSSTLKRAGASEFGRAPQRAAPARPVVCSVHAYAGLGSASTSRGVGFSHAAQRPPPAEAICRCHSYGGLGSTLSRRGAPPFPRARRPTGPPAKPSADVTTLMPVTPTSPAITHAWAADASAGAKAQSQVLSRYRSAPPRPKLLPEPRQYITWPPMRMPRARLDDQRDASIGSTSTGSSEPRPLRAPGAPPRDELDRPEEEPSRSECQTAGPAAIAKPEDEHMQLQIASTIRSHGHVGHVTIRSPIAGMRMPHNARATAASPAA